jgi:hypothetical protein
MRKTVSVTRRVRRERTTMLPDSGNRTLFEGGAQKDPGIAKGRFDLIPAAPLLRLAKHYQAGAEKYSARNWEKEYRCGALWTQPSDIWSSS